VIARPATTITAAESAGSALRRTRRARAPGALRSGDRGRRSRDHGTGASSRPL